MKHNHLARFVLLFAVSMILTGCGGGAPTVPVSTNYRAIHVSTNDCANDTNLSFDICATAVNSAIDAHTKTSPSYASERACTATEGAGKCERDMNKKYHPRLVAYLIEASDPPLGWPLYASTNGEAGFRDAIGTVYLSSDLTLEYSKRAKNELAKYVNANQKMSLF